MDILADANIGQKTIDRLNGDGHYVYVVTQARLSDPEVGRIANDKNALIVTNDVQTFLYENYSANGSIPKAGMVELRLDKLEGRAKTERVSGFIKEHGFSLNGKVAVVEPATERIRTIESVEKDIKQKQERQQQKKEASQKEKIQTKADAQGSAEKQKAESKEGLKAETLTKATVTATEKAVDAGAKVADKTLQTVAQVPLKATTKAVETAAQVAAVPLKAASKAVETVASVTPTVAKTVIQVVAVPIKAAATGIDAVGKTVEGVKIVGKGIKDELQGKKQEAPAPQPPPPTPKQSR